MKTNFLKLSAWAVTLLLATTLTSCVTERDEEVAAVGGTGTLVINVNSGALGTTRSTDLSDETALKNQEKMIQSMVVAVFHEGTMVYYNYLKDVNESAAAGFSTTVDNISSANKFADGDKVVIVANLPADDVFGSLSTPGTTTLTDFQNATVTVAQALDADGNGAVEANNLPMYGTADVTTADGHLKAAVTVRHMVSKVTLESLTVDGLATGCSFKPTQVFLYKVADKLSFNFSDAADVTTYSAPTLGTPQTGESGVSGALAYLGTKVYADADLEELSGTTVWSKTAVLYAMPNTTPGTNDAQTDTRLVIKGTWTDTSDASNNGDCYYNFRLLNVVGGVAQQDLDSRKIYPNRNYRLKVILKRKGALTIDDGVDQQSTTAVTISTVTEWDNGSQSTSFGSDGNATTTTTTN